MSESLMTHVSVTWSTSLNLSEAQVPFLHDGNNNDQVVFFRMKGIINVDHLVQCLTHRGCSMGSRPGVKLGPSAVRGKSDLNGKKAQSVGRAICC